MADIMNRSDVLSTVAAECDLSARPKWTLFSKPSRAPSGARSRLAGEVRIAGFGTFKTSQRSARTSRNPRTGEPVDVPARTAARFIPGKGLKTAAEGAMKATVAAPAKGAKTAAKAAPAKAAAAKAAPAKAAESRRQSCARQKSGEKPTPKPTKLRRKRKNSAL